MTSSAERTSAESKSTRLPHRVVTDWVTSPPAPPFLKQNARPAGCRIVRALIGSLRPPFYSKGDEATHRRLSSRFSVRRVSSTGLGAGLCRSQTLILWNGRTQPMLPSPTGTFSCLRVACRLHLSHQATLRPSSRRCNLHPPSRLTPSHPPSALRVLAGCACVLTVCVSTVCVSTVCVLQRQPGEGLDNKGERIRAFARPFRKHITQECWHDNRLRSHIVSLPKARFVA